MKKNAVANYMKVHHNWYNSISNALQLRSAGAITEGTVEGRATTGEVRAHDKQGCGVGVETGVAVGRSRPFCLESESEFSGVELSW